MSSKQPRVAVIAGARTPFLRIASGYSNVPSRLLAAYLVADLVERADIDKKLIDQLVFGQVVMAPDAPNICLLYTSPSPRDQRGSRMPSSA